MEQFAWTDDVTQILGLTSIGRATVEALPLNRERLVNLRRVLVRESGGVRNRFLAWKRFLTPWLCRAERIGGRRRKST